MKKWYEELFSNYAIGYDKEDFTQGTTGEVDFIEHELNFNKEAKILDIACGTGRHSIELAKRGYDVTGFDLSENQIERAKEKAKAENLVIDLKVHDARAPHFKHKFDLVIMLCEGGFSLMETDEMNFAIIKNATWALKDDGKIIFTCLNALYPLYHSVADIVNQNTTATKTLKNSFDVLTFRDINDYEVVDDGGNTKVLHCNERYYAPSELSFMLKLLGYKTIDIYGAKLGAYSRNHQLKTTDYEILCIASLK